MATEQCGGEDVLDSLVFQFTSFTTIGYGSHPRSFTDWDVQARPLVATLLCLLSHFTWAAAVRSALHRDLHPHGHADHGVRSSPVRPPVSPGRRLPPALSTVQFVPGNRLGARCLRLSQENARRLLAGSLGQNFTFIMVRATQGLLSALSILL